MMRTTMRDANMMVEIAATTTTNTGITTAHCECVDPSASTKEMDLFEQREQNEAFQNDCYMICWKGDGFCDDENNNEGCEYDGGYCCNNDYQWWDYYCTDCECVDPSASTKEMDLFEQREQNEAFQNDCYMICWKGDGFCADENNNEG